MANFELGVKAVEAAAPVAQAAERLAEQAFELSLAGKMATVDSAASKLTSLGDFSKATKLADDGVPGMSQEEFLNHMHSGTYWNMPVRVKKLGDTTGYLIHPDLIANRQVGKVGVLDHYIPGHGDVFGVTHADGSIAPYRPDEELEPAVLKPDARKDLPVVNAVRPQPFDDVSVGDTFKTRLSPTGKKLNAEHLEGYVEAEQVDGNGAMSFGGRTLADSEHVKFVGKDIDPNEVKVGDLLDINHPGVIFPGRYRVRAVHGLANGNTEMFGRFSVEGAEDNSLLLRNTHDLYGKPVDDGGLFSLPRGDVNNQNFYAMRELNPKPGDVLAVPHDALASEYGDFDFSMMRGRKWTVEQAAQNGVVVRNGDTVYALPKKYLTEPFVYNLDDYMKKGA